MWRRALAYLIDLIPLVLLAAIENVVGIEQNQWVGLANLLFLVGYFAGMEHHGGATPGKRIVGLQVAMPSSVDGFGQFLTRAIVKILCLVPPMTMVYGLIAIWRPDGRSLADLASNSTVVEAASQMPPRPLSLRGKLCASVLIVLAPWILLLGIMAAVFGWVLADNWEEIAPHLKLFMQS